MTTVVVSPHLDDAAVSASAVLGSGGATVVTVFTAMPPAGWRTTWWDRLTGAASSRQRQQERYAEDAEAMRLLSAESVYLDELEALYRGNGDGPPDLERATARMAECFAGADELWLPAAIGGHRDHVFARDAALRAAAVAGFTVVMLYADYPYVITYGWPAAATGAERRPYLDNDFWLDDQLLVAGFDPEEMAKCVGAVKLDTAQRERKARIIAAYASQARALGVAAEQLAADPSKLDYEIFWRKAV
jgi:LmbE family N-acetylglucosaminyl deacetylase